MKLSIFAASDLQRAALEAANAQRYHDLTFHPSPLSQESCRAALGSEAVCALSSDRIDLPLLSELSTAGVRTLVLSEDTLQFVDVGAAPRMNIRIAWVAISSPRPLAEYAVALMLALTRGDPRAPAADRTALPLAVGFELAGKTIGLIGLGPVAMHIGTILRAFGCTILAYDFGPRSPAPDPAIRLSRLDEIYRSADVISLHCPLTSYTRRLVDNAAISQCRRGVTLISTGSASLFDAPALVRALERGWVGGVGIDVNEDDADLRASEGPSAESLAAALRPFSNAVVTFGRGGLSREALLGFAGNVLDQAAGGVGCGIGHSGPCVA